MKTIEKNFSFTDFYEQVVAMDCQKNMMDPCGNKAITALIVRHGYLPICEKCLNQIGQQEEGN